MLSSAISMFIVLSLSGAPAGEADKLIDEGVDLREAGKDVDALAKFQKAYEISKSPRALAQIGLAEQALGRWLDAELHLEQAAAAKTDPWIKPRLAAIEGALDKVRERIGSLEVFGPAGAEVKVNNKPAAKLPMEKPIKVLAGTLNVEVSAAGFITETRSVVVPARGLARETIDLVKKQETVAAANPPGAQGAHGAQGTQTQATQATQSASSGSAQPNKGAAAGVSTSVAPSEGGGLTTYAWIAGGAAVAALGVGTAFLFVRNSHISKYNDDSMCLVGGRTRHENCSAELDSAGSAKTLMTVGWIAAAVLGGTSAALFVLDDSGDAPPARKQAPSGAKVSCGFTIGTFGVGCAGEF